MWPAPIVAALSKRPIFVSRGGGWLCVSAANRLSELNWPTFASEFETFFVTEGSCNNIQSMSMKKDMAIFR